MFHTRVIDIIVVAIKLIRVKALLFMSLHFVFFSLATHIMFLEICMDGKAAVNGEIRLDCKVLLSFVFSYHDFDN